jgi:putative ABC transport system substrate-binding protein
MRMGEALLHQRLMVLATSQSRQLNSRETVMQTRLTFIAAIALWVAGMPATVQAEQPKRIPQIGFLALVARADYDPAAKDPIKDGLLEGLNALGYVEGKNIHVDYRVPRKPEEIAEIARDLVEHKVDIIVTGGPQYIEAAKRATDSIPIVILACDRADRLVASIARPGGNITGMACVSSDLALKRLQLLQQIVPGLSHLAVLFNGGVPAKVAELQDITAAAKTLEVEVHSADVRDASGFAAAFAAIKGGNPEGLLILVDPLTLTYVKELAGFAAEQRLPSMFGFREFCDAGGLLCYGASLKGQWRRFGYFIDKILKGTKPGDIPIEEPTLFELIVNNQTAKSFGLALPTSILVSADQVIE